MFFNRNKVKLEFLGKGKKETMKEDEKKRTRGGGGREESRRGVAEAKREN